MLSLPVLDHLCLGQILKKKSILHLTSHSTMYPQSRHLQQNERVQEVLSVAHRWVQYRPRSLQAYAKLAELYEVEGQKELSIKAQREAVRWAREAKDKRSPDYENRLKELESQ